MVGVALTLGSATLFALGSVLMRTPLPIPPIALAAWQVGLGCFPIIILGLIFEKPVPGIGVIGAAVMLGEPLGLREVIAMALTLGGVTLALRKPAAA